MVSVRLENFTQIGRKKQLDRVAAIIKKIGGIEAIRRHKVDGSYIDFLSFISYEIGCSRKLANDYVDTIIQASRYKGIFANGEDLLDMVNQVI